MGLLSNLTSFLKGQPEAAPAVEVAPEAPAEAAAPAAAEVVAEVAAEAAPATAPELPTQAPVTADDRRRAEQLVRQLVSEVPGYLAAAVLESDGGRILSGQWAGHSGGATEAAVAHAELLRQIEAMGAALGLDPAEQVQEVLLQLRRQLHLLRPLPGTPWLLYLAVRSADANIALLRAVVQDLTFSE